MNCHNCGRPNPTWYAANQLWNTVMAEPDTTPTDDPGGILCPTCFITRAEQKNIKPNGWVLMPEVRCTNCHRLYWQVEPKTPHICAYCILKHR